MLRVGLRLAISIGLLLFAGQAQAQYRYTDEKGVSKVTQFKMEIPAAYQNTAVWVGTTNLAQPSTAPSIPVPQPNPTTPPATVAPGSNGAWWTLPEGSPERAAAKDAANRQAAELRGQANRAGVQDPEVQNGTSIAAASAACVAIANNRTQNGTQAWKGDKFKARADADGHVETYGTDSARFDYNTCMEKRGHSLRGK